MAKKSISRNVRQTRRAQHLDEIPAMKASTTRRAASSRRTSSANEERDMREILKEFLTSPTVKYIAGGLATALLTRLANNLSGRYPEISGFIRENMSGLEDRFGNLGRENTASRH